jgi:hypothetical protein
MISFTSLQDIPCLDIILSGGKWVTYVGVVCRKETDHFQFEAYLQTCKTITYSAIQRTVAAAHESVANIEIRSDFTEPPLGADKIGAFVKPGPRCKTIDDTDELDKDDTYSSAQLRQLIQRQREEIAVLRKQVTDLYRTNDVLRRQTGSDDQLQLALAGDNFGQYI